MRTRVIVLIVLAVAAVWGGFAAYDRMFGRDFRTFASDEEHFLYGSIGNDGAEGIPHAIWIVLPKIFPDYLPGPGGYASFGFHWAKGSGPHDPPVGFSKARVGVPRMAINCALCHTTTVRLSAEHDRVAIPGAVSGRVDIQAYQRFLAATAADSRFNADVLLPAITAEFPLSFIDRLAYRFLLIPLTRKALLRQQQAFAWTDKRPRWGPGRIDPFNPVKFGMLGLRDDGTIGNSDMQAIWNLDRREQIRPGGPLHWDGLNTSRREVFVSSALGDGAVADEFNWMSLERMEAYLRKLKPPASPHRPDAAAVVRGFAVFGRVCGDCHGEGGGKVLTIIPAQEIATDGHRLAMWTDAARDSYNGYGKGYDWGFKAFRNVEGYIAEPLWGLWATAPYLHNGSVPTLADLLKPPSERPAAFLRGSDIVDPQRGGMLAPACDPSRPGKDTFCFDTGLPGNGNGGHLYGTDLPAAEKDDLLAYLLTL
jgi:hypothetical protein